MPPRRDSLENPLVRSVASAFLWCAAFAFACAWFLPATKLLRDLPPVAPVSIGRATVDQISKARDYAGAALFYLLVPLLTVLFRRAGERLHRRLMRPLGRISAGEYVATSAAFAFPFLLAPFFYLTTRKELWGILLPPALGVGAVAAAVMIHSRRAFRQLFQPELQPFQSLILLEGAAWILFRYLVTGKRIAHIPTLFLEVVFVAFFLALFWGLALFVSRLVCLISGRDTGELMSAFAVGALPILVLPILGLTGAPAHLIVPIAFPVTALTVTLAMWRPPRWSAARAWLLAVYAAAPVLIFCLTYASTAYASPWFDVFHRGESIGPASDYLRGKVPYRDVFVLHGMLEDGLLDSALMKFFGRDLDVALARQVVVSALTMPMLWIIGAIALRSIPFALLALLLGLVISADNQRAVPQLLAVAALLAAVRRDSTGAVVVSGAFSGFAIFYSLDMGIYSVLGGVIATALLAWFNRRPRWLPMFAAGAILGAAPFLGYLALHNAVGEFYRNSFVVIPSVIDATWSVPFPDLAAPFRDFSVRTVADFLFTDKFRFILNPLVLGIASTYILQRLLRSRASPSVRDQSLLALLIFAILTQRSALGRADFPHQYFAAFLLPPILAILVAVAAETIRTIWRTDSTAQRIAVAAVIAAAVPVVFTALWMPDLLNFRLDGTVNYRERRAGEVYDVRGAQLEERLHSLSIAVGQMTRRGDRVFDFSNQPAIYFFVDRMNPTRFYQVPILSPIDHQMEAIEALARERPRLVFRRSPEGFDFFDGLTNELRAPAVAAFLNDHYVFHRNLRGIELWTPIPRRKTNLSAYRQLFGVPREASSAPRQRMIFPWFGEVPGADAPDWRSDLVIQNPHMVAVELAARYVWRGGTRDRLIRLRPRGGVVFDDAVRSLFDAPEQKSGTLWIEFPADRRPLVRVSTYPDSRRASTSVVTPLFETDAATGLTILNELTVAGLKEGESARIDLGVMNVGPAPMKFLVSVTDARGKPIGAAREGAAGEDEPYLLMDIRRELGIPPFEPITIHVRMISGSAIGYAAIVSEANFTRQVVPAVPTHARD